MDAARRRAHIKQQATLKKQQEGQTFKGTDSANPSTKRKLLEKTRKLLEKTSHLPKKPKTIPEPIVGLQAKAKKTATQPGPGKGKGLMMGSVPVAEKPPVVLCEDSEYSLEQLLSIITTDDYKDLSNHATKAMRETGLFCIAQVTTSVHFLFFFFLQLSWLLTLPSLGHVDDEGVDGALPES